MLRRLLEGTCFAVPLRSEGYGVGVLAAHDRYGIAVAHFFDVWFADVPSPDMVSELAYPDAVRCIRFGARYLQKGTWPAVGRLNGEWPVPHFCRGDLSGRWFRTSYDADDLRGISSERPISEVECLGLNRDVLSGPGSVEIVLTRLARPDIEGPA